MKCLNVLVVDDAKFICEHVTKIVHESFPSSVVKSAFNGEDAQQIMSSITFDLILPLPAWVSPCTFLYSIPL